MNLLVLFALIVHSYCLLIPAQISVPSKRGVGIPTKTDFLIAKRDEPDEALKPKKGNTGSSAQEGQALYGTMRLVSALGFVAGGIALIGFGSGKLSSATKSIAQMAGGGAAAGITAFIALERLFTNITLTFLVICVLIAAVAGIFLVRNGNVKIGNFGLGALMGLILAIILAQFVGTLFSNNIIRFLYFAAFGAIFGVIVMGDPSDKWLTISCLFTGSFGLVYGLDYLIFKSNFSNMATVAFNGGTFTFTQNTSIAFALFIIIFAGTLYMQKSKVFK